MYIGFETWLDSVLEENMPIDGVAVNFNIYEEEDSQWSLQLITTSCFNEEDSDWCCEEVFTTEDDLFTWKQENNWEEILKITIQMINKYLEVGKYADILKQYKAIATGFVDGDLEILYKR